MLRRGLSASLVLFVLGGLVIAGTYDASVTKIVDGKITVRIRTKDDRTGTEKTFKISKATRFITKDKTNKEEKEVNLKRMHKLIEKAAEKGRRLLGTIETTGEGDDETVTKITVESKGKGGKKKTDE